MSSACEVVNAMTEQKQFKVLKLKAGMTTYKILTGSQSRSSTSTTFSTFHLNTVYNFKLRMDDMP